MLLARVVAGGGGSVEDDVEAEPLELSLEHEQRLCSPSPSARSCDIRPKAQLLLLLLLLRRMARSRMDNVVVVCFRRATMQGRGQALL